MTKSCAVRTEETAITRKSIAQVVKDSWAFLFSMFQQNDIKSNGVYKANMKSVIVCPVSVSATSDL